MTDQRDRHDRHDRPHGRDKHNELNPYNHFNIQSELCVSIPLCLSQTLRGHKDIRKKNINSYHIIVMIHCTVDPLYLTTLTRGHPSYIYKAIMSGSKLCMIVSNMPLMRGHPSNKAIFFIPPGWPYERGTTHSLIMKIIIHAK